MELFQNKPDVLPVSAAYPFSGIKDDTGGNDGTLVNQNTLNDYVQFFEKVFNESGLTSNGLPDNATNGFQLVEAAKKVFRPYKSYVALISQTGTSAPTVTVLENQLGGSIVWSRNAAGEYQGLLSGAFTASKTHLMINQFGANQYSFYYSSANIVILDVLSGDGNLNNVSLEIRVYY